MRPNKRVITATSGGNFPMLANCKISKKKHRVITTSGGNFPLLALKEKCTFLFLSKHSPFTPTGVCVIGAC